MLYLTAEKIHDGNGWLPTGTTIELTEDGTIVALHPTPVKSTVYYDGVLAPGFVNVHGHLELSHMLDAIPRGTGLIPFLQQVVGIRDNYTEQQKKEARFAAYVQMLDNGIVAAGDIANTPDTLDVRALDKLHMHTFTEVLGFSELSAARSFGHALQTYHAFLQQPAGKSILRQSITPHAPYSVSKALFQLIDSYDQNAILSIHNQESKEENNYYLHKTGGIKDLLRSFGIDDAYFAATGMNSLPSYLQWMSTEHPFIFVHNTFTTLSDIQYAVSHFRNTHWCLCPNANLYIENTLPDIPMLVAEDMELCIGTDSLASNSKLCILSELCTIKARYSEISWESLLRWATRNGAFALGIFEKTGTIAPGKQPGIIELSGILDNNEPPSVKRII